MQNDPIVINERYLKQLQTTYADQVDRIDRLYGKLAEQFEYSMPKSGS